MTLIEINLTLIEFIVLPLVAIIFGATLYLFIKSQKSLQQTLRDTRKKKPVVEVKQEKQSVQHGSLVELGEQLARMRYENAPPQHEKKEFPIKKITHKEEMAVQDLKNTIAQQQKMLDS